MTGKGEPRNGDTHPSDFQWGSPRWREGDEVQGDTERLRRMKSDSAPPQRGAVDDEHSIDAATGTSSANQEPADREDATTLGNPDEAPGAT